MPKQLPKTFQFPSASSKISGQEEIENFIWTGLHFLVVLSTGGRHDKDDDGSPLSNEDNASIEFAYADEVIRRMQSRDHYRRVVRILVQAFKDQNG
jgi:hypothetical protein